VAVRGEIPIQFIWPPHLKLLYSIPGGKALTVVAELKRYKDKKEENLSQRI